MSKPQGPFFVCGAFYKRQKEGGKGVEEYFALVKSSGKGALPYVTDEAHSVRLHRLCQHHSHLYKVSEDFRALELVRAGDPATVGPPGPVSMAGLREDIRDSIIAAVTRGELWMVGT